MVERLLLLFAALIGLAGCHPSVPDNAVTQAAATPPAPSLSAKPEPSSSVVASVDLSGYVGHYPFDKIGGREFYDQPVVQAALSSLVPDEAVRTRILADDGPATPIAVGAKKRLIAWGCETHNCGDHNWAITIALDGTAPQICYHDQPTTGDDARWYVAPGKAEMRGGACPSGDQPA
jgi:hypothetical protein